MIAWRAARAVVLTVWAALLAARVEVSLRRCTLGQLSQQARIALATGLEPAGPAWVPSQAAVRRLRAVQRVFRHWPWDGVCLRRSLVAGRLLSAHDPKLWIGVRTLESGRLTAHAWLSVGGTALDATAGDYTVLPLSPATAAGSLPG